MGSLVVEATFLIIQLSIQLVSPASGEVISSVAITGCEEETFHSISFPSEWGVLELLESLANDCHFPFN